MTKIDEEKKKALKMLVEHAKEKQPEVMVPHSDLVFCIAYIEMLERELALVKQKEDQ